MNLDPSTTKYMVHATLTADGVVERPDVVGAIFGQTEGLLGNDLDLRDLQKSGRIGRIEVEVSSKKGKSEGTITMPTSMDKVETAILAAGLESIDRVGPCKAEIQVGKIEDVRVAKRTQVIDRAKALLQHIIEDSKSDSQDITEAVRQTVRTEEIVLLGSDKCPAGPNVEDSDAILIVEGRSDVLNLLKYGIRNAVAVEGTNIPQTIKDLCEEKVSTAFIDGDRGGQLILKEILQTCDLDFVAEAPQNNEVEELTQKQITKALRNKIPREQYIETHGIKVSGPEPSGKGKGGGQGGQQQQRQQQQKGGGRQKQEQKQQKQQKQEQKKPEPKGPDRGTFKTVLEELSGSLKARLLDNDGNPVGKDIAVRDLADTLKSADGNVAAVVFDGVITQRLLDIAADRKIQTLVGVKEGNVSDQPDNVDVLTKERL